VHQAESYALQMPCVLRLLSRICLLSFDFLPLDQLKNKDSLSLAFDKAGIE
jgi:hypothetical protein